MEKKWYLYNDSQKKIDFYNHHGVSTSLLPSGLLKHADTVSAFRHTTKTTAMRTAQAEERWMQYDFL